MPSIVEAEGLKTLMETKRLEVRCRLETDKGKDVRFANLVNDKAFNLHLRTLKATGPPFDHPAWKFFEWLSKNCALRVMLILLLSTGPPPRQCKSHLFVYKAMFLTSSALLPLLVFLQFPRVLSPLYPR